MLCFWKVPRTLSERQVGMTKVRMVAGTLAERYGESEYSDGGRMWPRIFSKYLRVHLFMISHVGHMNYLLVQQ